MSIFLKNVRLSFPDLFVAKQFQGKPDSPFLYKATFLVKPGSGNDKLVWDEINRIATNKWGAKAESVLAGIKGQKKEFCYLDGSVKEYAGFEGMWSLSSNRGQDQGPPAVIDRDKSPLFARDGKPYGGCYVNAKVSIWAQDNQWGKAMRCTLEAVQFAGDGDAFGGSGPASAEGFEEVVVEEVGDLM